MSGLFSRPKVPEYPKYSNPPTEDDKEIKLREAEEKRLMRMRRGRRATILTSGMGDTSTPVIRRTTLLGGGA